MTTSTTRRVRPRWPRAARRPWLSAGAALSMVAASLLVGPQVPAQAAEVTDGLALWYKLDETAGTVAKDSSGKNRDGTVNGAAGWTPGEGLAFNGTDTYVKVPDNVLAGMDAITVDLDVYVDPSLAGAYFIYGFGNSGPEHGNGYLFTTGNSLRTAIATGNWTTEQGPGTGRNLVRGNWKRITYTQAGSVGILYEDGAEVARKTGMTITPAAIGGGVTTANYIGRSLYRPDPLFKGRIRDFRLYDRAVTPTEVAQLAHPTATAALAVDKAALTLGDTSRVAADLPLPAPNAFGSTITWTSSDPSVVATDGKVTRPPLGRPAATVTLTATLRRHTIQDTKSFQITVLPEFNDSERVTRAVAAIEVRNLADVRDNLPLPARGEHGTTITWKSDRPNVITPTGEVIRPAGTEKVTVGLEATATLNGASATRKFDAIVPPRPPKQDLKGYLFSYFTGERKPDRNGEQIYLALSRGNNPISYRELNGGRPVLTSTIGDKGVRDPFIIRSPNGDKFYQIATDLRIDGNDDWGHAQRHGSKSIMVWESTDLVNWTNQRLVKVSPDTAGNTWAPEAFYERSIGAYVVFWASKIYAADDPNHTGSQLNQMMYATTRDFHTFSEPKPYFDRKFGEKGPTTVIDTTMIEHDGTYYRFTKDERDPSATAPNGKSVFQEKGDSVLGTFAGVTEGIGRNQQIGWSEGPTIFKSNTEEKWYLFVDEHGNGGYKPLEADEEGLKIGLWTRSVGAQLPTSPRHGTVLPVTQAEYDRILRKYVPGELVDDLAETKVRTLVGTAPQLPATVTATYADKTTKDLAVTWAEVPASDYAKPGTFTVLGTVKADYDRVLQAKAVVTVVAPDKAQAGPDVSGAEGAPIALAGTATGEGAVAWSVRPGAGVDDGATCTVAAPGTADTRVTCTDDGTYEAELKVGASTDTATVTVTNAAPKIGDLQAPGSAPIGAAVTVKAPFADAGSHDTHTCAVDWKDGTSSVGAIAAGSCSATHRYASAGSYAATVTVTDDDGAADTRSHQITVAAPARLTAGPDVTGAEGAAIRLAGTATGRSTWTYRALSGVDRGATCRIGNAAAPATTITCTDDGRYEVTLAGGGLSDKATVTVTNAVPTVTSARGPAGQVRPGTSVGVTAAFTDPGSNDRHTCRVNWRDGSTSTGTVSGGACVASHSYRAGGSYDVTVTVTDDDSGAASRVARVTVKASGAAGGTGVPASGGYLPRTGYPLFTVAAGGLGLLVLGLVLVLAGRGRRVRSSGAGS